MENNDNNLQKNLYEIESKLYVAFTRLIGPLSMMANLKTYQNDHKEIKQILDKIVEWSTKFQTIRNLDFIMPSELLDTYNKLDKLKEKYIFEIDTGNEDELSDEAVIWLSEIMQLRKKLINMRGEEENVR